jgi:hypothetical protein
MYFPTRTLTPFTLDCVLAGAGSLVWLKATSGDGPERNSCNTTTRGGVAAVGAEHGCEVPVVLDNQLLPQWRAWPLVAIFNR